MGMSGGVDSSVAAVLLQQQGYEVIGVFMKNWSQADLKGECPWEQEFSDMREVCDQLGIPYYTFNFEQEYRDRVFQYFLREYQAGRTPNPDVLCNTEIKFRVFLDRATSLQADYIATGHYAKVEHRDDEYYLLKSADQKKDQTYFIHHLTQAQLARILFPIGHLLKKEVRGLAEQVGLRVSKKPDSQGICFIGKVDFREFLGRYIPKTPGKIQTIDDQELGEHVGLPFYTIGQRQGIGIGGTGPYYVVSKDLQSNTLIVAQGENHSSLFHTGLSVKDLHWINSTPTLDRLQAKIRYQTPEQECTINLDGAGGGQVKFFTPQRAITPGQFIVFYKDDECLGGGVIHQALD